MNIQQMILNCHARAKAAGWWAEYDAGDDIFRQHFIAGKIALVHSELSEALEGWRKGLMDDHLPHRKMTEVELADTLIRIFDLAGGLSLEMWAVRIRPNQLDTLYIVQFAAGDSGLKKHIIAGLIGDIHEVVSLVHIAWRRGWCYSACAHFAMVVQMSLELGELLGYDIPGAISEKLDYNAVRPDHKLEVRMAEGGKSL